MSEVLPVENVPREPEAPKGRTWRELADQISAALGMEPIAEDELEFALWNYTAFGFAGHEYVGWQLAAYIADPKGTIQRADEQLSKLGWRSE